MIQSFFNRLPLLWKLATLRCALYAALVGWGAFLVGVEGYDSFDAMSAMQKIKLVGGVLAAMGGTWLAFLDNTTSELKKKGDDGP